MNPITIITISCLIASVSCANFPRSPRNLQPAQSQLAPQALPAPGSPSDVVAKAAAQQAKLHYVEIDPSLKGNYKFGYDTGSGPAGQSFREETRLDDGTVKGAYGYVDANGKQRIVKYTAGKAGFVVEGDQEAPGQGSPAAQPAEPAPQPAEVRRPQPVNLPQQAAQPQFDDQQPQLNRNAAVATAPAQPTAEDRARAEQLHAEGLRQHQLATQAALAQQQKLAQQLHQLQQQQIAAAQRQAPQQAPQQPQQQPRQQLFQQQQPQQQQPQFSAAPQPQFGAQPQPQQPAAQPQFAAHPHHHHQQQQHAAHIVDPQSGSFFSSSNDANLNQLLQNQLRHLQSGNQFAGQQFPQQQPQHQPQQFAAPQQPATDFNQLRAARQVAQQQPAQQQQQQFSHHQGLSPANALATLHQQHQQDAQMLAALRAQQLARLQEQSRQAPRAQFEQPQPQFQAEARQQAQFAPQPEAQFAAQQPQQPTGHRLPGPQASLAPQPQSSAAAPTVVAQPENFGPPVIDIRTLNYSIGQQTRV